MKKQKDKSKPPVSAHRLNGERWRSDDARQPWGAVRESSTTETLQAEASGRKNTKKKKTIPGIPP